MSSPALVSFSALPASCLLLDARPSGFAQGHLPGALPANLNTCLSSASAPDHDPARGGRHPLPEPSQWAAQLAAWGLTPDTRVVAYDDALGGNGAARLWWMLRAAGHTRVALLDGPLPALLAAPAAPAQPVQRTPVPAPRLEHWLAPTVTLEQVDRLRQDPDWKVLDVRSRPRYRGETEPIDPVAGHIPGALNLPYTENLDAQGRFKAPEALRAMYQAFLADTPPDHLVVHCGSGVTACHTLFALDLAGLGGASLYVGSWSEWCRRG
jgi:thiosulfate/3-mercaptopyruvate sulfurtransferase